MPGFAIGGNSSPLTPSNKVEFHRAHRWRVGSLGFPTGLSAAGSLTTRRHLYAHTIQLPSLSFEEEKIKGSSVTYKIASSANWDNVSVKFYDIYGLYKELKSWQDLIWTPEQGIKPASGYKGNPIFVMTNNKGDIIQTYELVGAYPHSVSHGDLSYTDSEIKLLTVTYSFDYAKITLND